MVWLFLITVVRLELRKSVFFWPFLDVIFVNVKASINLSLHLPWCFIVFTIIIHFQCQNIWEGLFSFLVIFPSCDLYLIENSYVISAIYWLSVLFWAYLLVFINSFPFPCYFPFPSIHQQKRATSYSLKK